MATVKGYGVLTAALAVGEGAVIGEALTGTPSGGAHAVSTTTSKIDRRICSGWRCLAVRKRDTFF